MSNFQSKLLGLAGLAVMFAGTSFGQQFSSCQNAKAAPGPLSLRAESTTELTADLVFDCTESVGAIAGTGGVQIFTSAPATSRVVDATTGNTEATLFVCTTVATCTTLNSAPNTIAVTAGVMSFPGVISGNIISFQNVAFPATGTGLGFRVSNIRMNTNAVTLTSTLTNVTAQALVASNNTSVSSGSPVSVGYVFKSLATPTLVANPNGSNTPAVTPYTVCAGNALPTDGTTLTTFSFLVSVAEQGQGGFFKTKLPGTNVAGETGSYTLNGNGLSDFGTRIQLAFGNVPSAATLYLPTIITVTGGGGNPLQLVLVGGTASSAKGAPGAGTANAGLPSGFGETFGASASFTPTNNAVTAVYEVANANNAVIHVGNIPVWVTFPSGAFTLPQSAITVVEGYAPQVAAASATTVPNFAPVMAPVLNGTSITLCSTNLLFPFVTSALGFDTGIALANTSADPFGTTTAPGVCALNFYGTGQPTPNTGIPAPGGIQAPGSTTAFLASQIAAGFTGYVIAQCSYQFGHGFAYITYGFGQSQATAMGYVANILDRTHTGPESLGN